MKELTRRDFVTKVVYGLGASLVLPSVLMTTVFAVERVEIMDYFKPTKIDNLLVQSIPSHDIYRSYISCYLCKAKQRPITLQDLRYYYGCIQTTGIVIAAGKREPKKFAHLLSLEMNRVRTDLKNLLLKTFNKQEIMVVVTKDKLKRIPWNAWK